MSKIAEGYKLTEVGVIPGDWEVKNLKDVAQFTNGKAAKARHDAEFVNRQSEVDMKESQNIEFKTSWRDEYLKWICGYANADGGTLYIGKDDNGNVVGLTHIKKLLEDIPNKVRDILGIMVDVNLKSDEGEEYLEVMVGPYPYPVSRFR